MVLLLFFSISSSAFAAQSACAPWPLWQDFARIYIEPDGRVVDRGSDGISTSEGQSYALFFALVANDKARFDSMLNWTESNMAQGSLKLHLPAWKWGKAPDGAWKVLDVNSASDSDLWIAYVLFQAADHWKQKSYRELGSAMLRNISRREVADLPLLGSMLLPASYGFAVDAVTWRLNPSYAPIQLLRYFAKEDKNGPWEEVARNTVRMIATLSNNSLIPDWVLYGVQKGFYLDAGKGEYTSYESIRVYLWWAMLNERDPLYADLRGALLGVKAFAPENVALPERINVKSGVEEGRAPAGFAAALAPYRRVLYRYTSSIPASFGDSSGYYDAVLSMMGYGWLDERYQFNADGSLKWGSKNCTQ